MTNGANSLFSANQIRGGSATCDLARLRKLRLDFRTLYPGRRARRFALALGYIYITPDGVRFAALQIFFAFFALFASLRLRCSNQQSVFPGAADVKNLIRAARQRRPYQLQVKRRINTTPRVEAIARPSASPRPVRSRRTRR